MTIQETGRGLARAALTLLIMSTSANLVTDRAMAELIGHWTLDDGQSDPGAMTALDSSGNGHDGVLTSFLFAPVWVDGKYGGALDFASEPGAVVADIADDLPIDNEPRTVAAWINLEFPAQAFFASYGAGGAGGQFSIGVEDNGGIPNIRLRHGGGNMFYDGEVIEGEWNHVAVVVPDGIDVTGDVRMYLNGEEVFSDTPTDVFLATAFSEFVIGGKWGVPDNRAFEGIVDDVWLFNEALDQAAIVEIMNGGAAAGATPLQAGDANMDLTFDQLDLVQVQIAAKYLTGADATWGEGDWDGAPGGEPGNPPAGDGKFNQLDIIAALGAGKYLTGPYAALAGSTPPGAGIGDNQTSIVYDPSTGELAVDAPAGTNLTSINIDSESAIFTGEPAQNLGGSFDNDSDNNIFKATFGSSFGSLSFGNVVQPGLSEAFVVNDLTAVGSLEGGGDLGPVDLIYIPEPSAMTLLALGLAGLLAGRRSR